ncbi:hypothetical protein FACS1894159_04440 [Bacteroidia bacterium]|nr:hypothetical protein FACS1894159_04440 [Bacteroidia bacterium]
MSKAEAPTARQQAARGDFIYAQTQNIRCQGLRAVPSEGLTVTPQSWSNPHYPCQGDKISDYGIRNGRMHSGVDIKARPGDTIRAIADGVVRMSKEYYGYGNMVVVSHSNGLESLYGHNTRNLVEPNQWVHGGQAIALAGRTGRATTEHCHFELRAGGEYFDPGLALDYQSRRLKDQTIFVRLSEGKAVATVRGDNKKTPATVASAPSASGRANTQTASPSGKAKTKTSAKSGAGYHIVIKGDTLYAISRRYGVDVDRLCRLNSITPNATLRIGQKIRLR